MTDTRYFGINRVVIALLIFFSTLSVNLFAQDPPTWQFKFGGKVTEFNEKKQKDVALEGATITLLKGGNQVQQQSTNNSGKFKFSLDPNNEYTVTVTKSGYITKRFAISTYNVSSERAEFPFAEFDVEIGIFKLFPGLDYSCLDKPIAKISFNPAKDVDDFDYDKVYTASIQSCIENLKRLEAEARAKQKLYEAAIDRADKAFGASQWQLAKDDYNEALGYLPNEQYPKDQIVKCDANMGANAANEKKYNDAIAEANRLYDAKDWVGAKVKYQEASGLKPTEQYPKDRIILCDQNIASDGKQKQYDDAIAAADVKFKASDWAEARAKYQEASGMKPVEQYPKDQIGKCDSELTKAGVQKQYDDAIAAADAKFKAADFAGAKVDYQKASGIKSAEQYPKDQIVKCDEEMAKAGLQKQYDDAIAVAGAKFKAADFAGAKVDYQQASTLKSTEQYPKDQIVKCDAEIAKAGLDKQFKDAIAAADLKFKASDWAESKAEYLKASALKSAEQYPKDQIKLCDDNIAKAGLDKQYNDAIAAADADFKASDWAGAKTEYQKASTLKSAEQYPSDQIEKCEVEIAKQGLDKQYNDAIAAADAKFKAADFAGAMADYVKALSLKSAEQYPKDQIVKCDAEIAKQVLDKQYKDAIAAADEKFKASDWAGAKVDYQNASTLKSAEQYPKDQIKICDDNVAKAGLDKQYTDAITAADKLFVAKNWAGAKVEYEKASALKSAEQYPKDRIKLCDDNIAKDGLDKQYADLITDADAKFKASDWFGARGVYQQASDLKTGEKYPRDQIAACDAKIAGDVKNKEYNDLIGKADAKFKTFDWSGAKEIYLQATALKSAEKYPKDQVILCDKNITAEAKNQEYTLLIGQADAKFKASDWAGAKAIYQQASGLKVAEAYPKDQIIFCDANIGKAGIDKQYADLIAKADAKFGTKDWAGAKTIYLQATAVKATEQYPKDKAAECDKNIAVEKDAKYNAIVASADSLFKLKEFASAKGKYKEANTSRPTEAYPKDQMAKCDAEIAKQGLDKQYNEAIAAADAKFKASEWSSAKSEYQKASALKSSEQYPKDQIAKCELEISKQGLDKQYSDAIAAADKKFTAEDWAGAKVDYVKASGLKSAEQYPKDQIVKCDINIAKSGTDKLYNAAIAAADVKFKASDWAGAKSKYEEALKIKVGEAYPTDQIVLCNDNIAAVATKKYTDAIAAADAKFDAADYTAAKAKYQEASATKPTEQYPKDRIKACDDNIATNGLDKTYNAAIAAADAKFKTSDWAGAKAKYQEASSLKSAEQYPKDQIALCDKNIAALEGLDANYSKAIARGDSAFKVEDYETAKSSYETALNLKPGQAYPKAQIDEINKRLALINAGNAKDAKYRATLATADSLFKLKDYRAAQGKYKDASVQRPLEQYPKDKYGECQRLMGDQAADAARQKRYDDLIKKADAKFTSGDWSAAKTLYEDALKEKPIEVYPKTRIAECDRKLNPTVKVDTARTPEQIKEDYRNEIARLYPQGLTTMQEKEGGTTTLKRIVVIGEKGTVYTMKSYSWGIFYFKDGAQISEVTFNNETSPKYIQTELSKVPK